MDVHEANIIPLASAVGTDGGYVRECVYLFTDIVGSTAYKSRHGASGARKAILEHDRLFRGLLEASGGRLNKDTGDGFLAVFDEPVSAVALALNFQTGLRAALGESIRVRVALNQGEAYFHPDPELPGGEKLIGLAVDQTAHLMQLADPGQILLTRGVFDEARAGWTGPPAGWFALGERPLKSGGEPFEIFEVAPEGSAARPADPARPAPVTDSILGWRPAAGAPVEGRPGWMLVTRLGQGSVGEVWETVETETGRRAAFKFCFSESRVRRLRREWELFQFIERELGVRNDIIHPTRLELDRPPFHMEMELAERGDLAGWLARNPGLSRSARIDLVIGAAEALDAAHSVGVIHGDIKPHNILIFGDEQAGFRPALADFGIGKVILPEGGRAEISQSLMFTDHQGTNAGLIGTRTYMAPELIAGARLSIQSDIYSLGVVLYQTLLGDTASPIAEGWQRRVDDPLLCADIARAIDLDPALRFGSARELAASLRKLDARRRAQAFEESERRRRAKSARVKMLLTGSLFVMTAATLFFGWVTRTERARALRESQLRSKAEHSEKLAITSLKEGEFDKYVSQLALARSFFILHDRLSALETLLRAPIAHRGWEWGALMARVAPETLDLYDGGAGIRRAWMTPDSAWIVAAADDGIARIWDGRTGKIAARCRGHEKRLLDLAPLPNQRGFIVACEDGEASAWDFQGRPLYRLNGHGGPINRIDADERSGRILTASDDGTARLWSAVDGAPLATLSGHSNWVNNAIFDRSGRWIATASDDATARVWDSETGAEAMVLRGHEGAVNDLAFQPAGNLLSTVSDDKTTRIWNLNKNGECERVLRDRETAVRLVKWIDNDQLVTTELGHQIHFWNLKAGEHPTIVSSHRLDPRALEWSDQDGGYLAVGGTDGVARLWDRKQDLMLEFPISRAGIGSLQILPGPKRFMATTSDGRIQIVCWEGPRYAYRTIEQHIRRATFLSEHRIAFGKFDHAIGVFDLKTRQTLKARPHDANMRALEGTPDGGLAVGYEDGHGLLLDSRDLSVKASLEGHSSNIRGIRGNPDGRMLTCGEDGRTRLWDWRTGADLGLIDERNDWILAVGFLATGEPASIARDGIVSVFPKDSGPMRIPLKFDSGPARVIAAEFSPDGERIAAMTSNDGGVWRTRDGSRISKFERAFGDGAREIKFLPHGTSLAVTSGEATVFVFDQATGRLLMPLDWIGAANVRQAAFDEDGSCVFVSEGGQMSVNPPIIPPGAFAGSTDPTDQAAFLREAVRKLRFDKSEYAGLRPEDPDDDETENAN